MQSTADPGVAPYTKTGGSCLAFARGLDFQAARYEHWHLLQLFAEVPRSASVAQLAQLQNCSA